MCTWIQLNISKAILIKKKVKQLSSFCNNTHIPDNLTVLSSIFLNTTKSIIKDENQTAMQLWHLVDLNTYNLDNLTLSWIEFFWTQPNLLMMKTKQLCSCGTEST